jgi:hypothetical protein
MAVETSELLDLLIEKVEKAQVIRMFRNSAMDAEKKLKVLDKEIEELKAAILLKGM